MESKVRKLCTLCCLFFNFTQFVILENLLTLDLATDSLLGNNHVKKVLFSGFHWFLVGTWCMGSYSVPKAPHLPLLGLLNIVVPIHHVPTD